MRKLLIYICIFTLVFSNISIASIKRTADFRVEELIPIDIIEIIYKDPSNMLLYLKDILFLKCRRHSL